MNAKTIYPRNHQGLQEIDKKDKKFTKKNNPRDSKDRRPS